MKVFEVHEKFLFPTINDFYLKNPLPESRVKNVVEYSDRLTPAEKAIIDFMRQNSKNPIGQSAFCDVLYKLRFELDKENERQH